MATEATKDFKWRYGNTEELTLKYTDSDLNAIDLTGYTAKLSLASDVTVDTSDLTITASWPNGNAAATMVFQATEAQTRTLVPSGIFSTVYSYSVELVNDSIPSKKTILSGRITVERGAYVE